MCLPPNACLHTQPNWCVLTLLFLQQTWQQATSVDARCAPGGLDRACECEGTRTRSTSVQIRELNIKPSAVKLGPQVVMPHSPSLARLRGDAAATAGSSSSSSSTSAMHKVRWLEVV